MKTIKVKNVEIIENWKGSFKDLKARYGKHLNNDELKEMYSKIKRDDRPRFKTTSQKNKRNNRRKKNGE